MTWTATLYDPVYAALGVPATMTLSDDTLIEFERVMDKTAGVEVQLQGVETTTVRPAIVARMADLTSAGVVPADLRDALVEVNEVSWKVISYFPKPSPMGERDGEIYIILTEGQSPG